MSHIYPFPLSHSNLRTILALSSLYDYWKCVVCSQWSLELRWEINPGYPLGVADAWGLAHHLLPPRMVISRKVERELSRHFAIGCRHPTKALSTTPMVILHSYSSPCSQLEAATGNTSALAGGTGFSGCCMLTAACMLYCWTSALLDTKSLPYAMHTLNALFIFLLHCFKNSEEICIFIFCNFPSLVILLNFSLCFQICLGTVSICNFQIFKIIFMSPLLHWTIVFTLRPCFGLFMLGLLLLLPPDPFYASITDLFLFLIHL